MNSASQQFEMVQVIANINAVNQTTISDATATENKKYRKEWKDWCNRKGFLDEDLVYEEKIWLFVDETLVKSNTDGSMVPRLKKPKGRPSTRTPARPMEPIGRI